MNSAVSTTNWRSSGQHRETCSSWRAASFRTSHLNLRIAVQLGQWAERDGTGLATESLGRIHPARFRGVCAGCSVDSKRPSRRRPEEQQHQFLPLCPDFVIELLSPSDVPSRTHAKMHEYIDNGLRLGWLIDPFERRVHVYRPGAAVQVLDDPDGVDGAPVLPGFRLDLGRIW